MTRLVMANVIVWSGTAALSLGAGASFQRSPDAVLESLSMPVVAVEEVSLSLPSDSLADKILDRPLFTDGRRPPVINTVMAGNEDVGLHLTGTGGMADNLTATIRTSNGESLRLRAGMRAAGWHVDVIETKEVQLSRDGQTLVLKLGDENAPPPAATSSPKTPTSSQSAASAGIASRGIAPDE